MSRTLDHALSLHAVPVGKVDWCPTRAAIWAGYGAADGQELSRATYPDIWSAIEAGTLPNVDEATWQADPASRGKYSTGDGSTTFRMPDYNGVAAGSHGAVYLTGDGVKSAGENGLIRADEMQQITASILGSGSSFGLFMTADSLLTIDGAFSMDGDQGAGASASGGSRSQNLHFDSANSPDARTNSYTHGTDVSGCWVIRLFGAVVNVGSADAAQLASDYTNLNAAFQALDGQVDFSIIYPNGGTEAAPANISANTRYVESNPFPGHQVVCFAEIQVNGEWGAVAWATFTDGHGVFAGQLNDGDIVIQTGKANLTNTSENYGNLFGIASNSVTTAPSRVKVWKIKGATS